MKNVKVTFLSKNSKPVTIICEVAKSLTEKMKGLMYCEDLDSNKGMLFTFAFSWIRFFWMKNVKIPLDIIFVNRKFEIVAICEASVEKGFFNKIYWSKGSCKYVVETNIGFCKKHRLSKGDKIVIK
jgi:uncharacterized membrane protein (UPF0127 family)